MEDVAWLRSIGVRGGEETSAGACRIKYADLRLRDLLDGVAAGFNSGPRRWDDGNLAHAFLKP